MKKTNRTLILSAVAFASGALGIAVFGGGLTSTKKISSLADRPDLLRRGEYLVHRVGMCIECHSPRNESGEFLEGRHLTGSPLDFKPVVEMPWMPAAPRLAGLPAGYTEEELAHFLMTGERPHVLPPVLPPMPPYRLSRDDAEAIAGYVHSLPSN